MRSLELLFSVTIIIILRKQKPRPFKLLPSEAFKCNQQHVRQGKSMTHFAIIILFNWFQLSSVTQVELIATLLPLDSTWFLILNHSAGLRCVFKVDCCDTFIIFKTNPIDILPTKTFNWFGGNIKFSVPPAVCHKCWPVVVAFIVFCICNNHRSRAPERDRCDKSTNRFARRLTLIAANGIQLIS